MRSSHANYRRTLRNELLENRLLLTCTAGDFNSSGALEHADVDALISQIRPGTNNLNFDLNGDGMVNSADLDDWMINRAQTFPGDANLDHQVDASDFNAWHTNRFTESGTLMSGDFSGDGVTDVRDFNRWNEYKFQVADNPGPALALGLMNDTGSPYDRVTSDVGICDKSLVTTTPSNCNCLARRAR